MWDCLLSSEANDNLLLLFVGSDKDADFDVVVYAVEGVGKDFLLVESKPCSRPDTFFNSEMLSGVVKPEEAPDDVPFNGIGGVDDL